MNYSRGEGLSAALKTKKIEEMGNFCAQILVL